MLAHHNESCHLKKMRNLLPLALCIVPLSFLLAEKSVSNADLSRKLDLILGKVGGLEERVSRLETDNQKVKKDVKLATKSAQEAKLSSEIIKNSRDSETSDSFFKNLRNRLQSEEDKATGPWSQAETWKNIRRNLTRYQVRSLLGNPHEVKTSLDPRIDQIYSYQGDLDADGKEEEALINFYRDRVVSFRTPFKK